VKVVYESVERLIRQAVLDADKANRRIAHIELSAAEANELTDTVRKHLYVSDPAMFTQYYPSDAGKKVGYYMGVQLQIAEAQP
jgi:hypothetical protein